MRNSVWPNALRIVGFPNLVFLLWGALPQPISAETISMRCDMGRLWYEYVLNDPFWGKPSVSELYAAWDNPRDWCPEGLVAVNSRQATCSNTYTYRIDGLAQEVLEENQTTKLEESQTTEKPYTLTPSSDLQPIARDETKTGLIATLLFDEVCPEGMRDDHPELEGCNVDEKGLFEKASTGQLATSPTLVLQSLSKEQKAIRPLIITETRLKKLDFARERYGWYARSFKVQGLQEVFRYPKYPSWNTGENFGSYRLCNE